VAGALVSPREDWLVILLPIQTYSAAMEPVRMAQPGDWYRVTSTIGDYVLAVREDDADQQAVLIFMDGSSVRRLDAEGDYLRQHQRLQMVTNQFVEAYSIYWEPVDLGERAELVLLLTDGGYGLFSRVDDPEVRLWIRLGPGVEMASTASPV
jgi:hypothetical protein